MDLGLKTWIGPRDWNWGIETGIKGGGKEEEEEKEKISHMCESIGHKTQDIDQDLESQDLGLRGQILVL